MDYTSDKFKTFIADCIDKMGEIIGDPSLSYTTAMYNSTKENSGLPVEPWYSVYTWDEVQEGRFEKWFINEYCYRFRQNKRKGIFSGKKTFEEFNLRWGLRRNDLYLEIEE